MKICESLGIALVILTPRHLRALAQRVEVDTGEVRIIGSKSRLLQTLIAKPGVKVMLT